MAAIPWKALVSSAAMDIQKVISVKTFLICQHFESVQCATVNYLTSKISVIYIYIYTYEYMCVCMFVCEINM